MKKTLATLIAIALISGMAAASDTRIASLGAASTFIKDYTDIYFLPSNLTLYPRQINAELGTYPASYPYYGSASVTWTNDEEQTWGAMGLDINHEIYGEVMFNNDITLINGGGLMPPAYGITIPSLDNKFHLFYAKKFGGMTGGLHLARAAGLHTSEGADSVGNSNKEDFKSGLWHINAGISMNPNENISVEAAFIYNMMSFEADAVWTPVAPGTAVGGTIESDGGSAIAFGARVFYGMSDALKLVPAFEIDMYNIGYKTSIRDTLATPGYRPCGGEKSSMLVGGAFGLNYQPHENVTLIGGLHLAYATSTIKDTMGVFYPVMGGPFSEVKVTSFTLPGFSAGVEAELLKWMWLRFGASKMLTKSTSKYTENPSLINEGNWENSTTDAPYAFSFGLGLKFGRLSIDAKLNDDQPFNLGYLMSGDNTNSNPFTQVSVSYSF
jgi:hypothetical protein